MVRPCAHFDLSMSEDCVICKQPIVGGTGVTLGEKGSSTINRASAARIDTINAIPGQQECRRKYCNPQQIAKTVKLGKQEVQPARHVLRSAEQQFNFCTDCFFCGKPATFGKKRKSSDVFTVRTVEMRDTIL